MFNVGDKVVYTSDWQDVLDVLSDRDDGDEEEYAADVGGSRELLGKVGIVVVIDGYEECPIAVDFGFEFTNSHSLAGRIDTRTGYWVNEAFIKPMSYKVLTYEEML
jgi:hypothetical protein